MSYYPPGVTGNEYAISGAEWEGEAPPSGPCEECGITHLSVTWQAHRDEGLWWVCECGYANDVTEDEWEAMNRWRSRQHRRRGRKRKV